MVWDSLDDFWERGIAAAHTYREANGNLHVPDAHVTADGFRLGDWIYRQRQSRLRHRLSPGRVAVLDTFGMVWDDVRVRRWERGIAAARAYREANGHLHVHPEHISPDGFKLGIWITGKRQARVGGRRSITVEQIAELVGFANSGGLVFVDESTEQIATA